MSGRAAIGTGAAADTCGCRGIGWSRARAGAGCPARGGGNARAGFSCRAGGDEATALSEEYPARLHGWAGCGRPRDQGSMLAAQHTIYIVCWNRRRTGLSKRPLIDFHGHCMSGRPATAPAIHPGRMLLTGYRAFPAVGKLRRRAVIDRLPFPDRPPEGRHRQIDGCLGPGAASTPSDTGQPAAVTRHRRAAPAPRAATSGHARYDHVSTPVNNAAIRVAIVHQSPPPDAATARLPRTA